MTQGWLFDTYPVGDKMVSWIKDDNTITRIEDSWTPSIYVGYHDKSELEKLSYNKRISSYIADAQCVQRFEKVADQEKSTVLQLQLKNSNSALQLAKIIESLDKFRKYRLYNVDVPPAQNYFYYNDIFPFGKFTKNHTWVSNDSIESTDYDIPDLKMIHVSINPKKQSKIAKFTDKIDYISVDDITIQSRDESSTILEFVNTIKNQDPDFIITNNGDSFDFPYLVYRAQENYLSTKLVLGRENVPLQRPRRTGTSYFSYGKMYFKPSAVKLLGRIHIDISGCFIWNNKDDIHGLYEIARVCRMPMQTASRASIGKCMSSLQFYNATRRGLLIPWKPTMAEAFKPRSELLIGDRGGLVFEPEIGVFENVAELDFASLYGTIMEKKNISAETILCACCPDSENKTPELNYHICKRIGIVPQSLHILLKKRRLYTDLLAKSSDNKIYDARKSALKWILVTSFGYLGFNNAKFGRIDAHMAVCAFARHILLQAVRIAESHGFRVLHGIVDSLWVYKKDSTRKECEQLRDEIVKTTGFDMSLDVYKWLVFLSSKEDKMLPVANQYFGAFENGTLKIRGIETRRHDTPIFFKRCQMEILNLMTTADRVSQVQNIMPQAVEIYKKYCKMLEDKKVRIEELSFTTRASKDVKDYRSNTIQTDAMQQLKEEGESIKAGQKIQYIITDYSRKTKRAAPLQMAEDKYDVKRYAKLLAQCCNTITKPFGMEVTP
jgi:DNA polymerase, archaea type